MTPLPKFSVIKTDFDALLECTGQIVILVSDDQKLDAVSSWINKVTKGALERFLCSEEFKNLLLGNTLSLSYPTDLSCKICDDS